MTRRIFRSTLLAAVAVLICSLVLVLGVVYNYFDQVQIRQLQDELRLAAAGTELNGIRFLHELESQGSRITWIDTDGTVIFDTTADAASMANHAAREEIQEAMQTGYGSCVRQSETLLEQTVYEAMRLSDGSILRISMSRQTMFTLLLEMLSPVLLVILLAIGLSAFLAHRFSRKIVAPLNSLDLEHPLENDTYEEISPLLRRINRQHLQIRSQLQDLKQKTDEFDQITASMHEGLVLLNRDGLILSINPTARALFDAPEDCVGKTILAIDRSPELRDAVNAALDNGHGSVSCQRKGRQWRFDLSRIESDGMRIGVVILAFDVTEVMSLEKKRREFSANVSHELKTPLQAILGSAELLENGMVKEEDIPRFTGHIRKEAARLMDLIGDIIRLSQLDEETPLPQEEVALLSLAEEVAAELERKAARKKVTVEVLGQPYTLRCVKQLMYEILFNLCDNAIGYNVEGGKVQIRVEEGIIRVSDTGIGIPPEHQDRVFERFYRVDNSHSKATGGTGLGLSIVKHAAQQLGAEITLESSPGKGTTVTVKL